VPVNAMEFVGPMLVAAALAGGLTRMRTRTVQIGAAIAAALVVTVPLGRASAAIYFLGTFGPLSAATLVMAGKYLYAVIANVGEKRRPSNVMLVCLLVIGAAFYPPTFGLTSFDPYEFGYRGIAVPALMLLLVLLGWALRAADVVWWTLIAALLYVAGAYDSRNLWDYLIVPFDPLFAVGVVADAFVRSFARRRRAGAHQAAAKN
jgi:hypothetical protein